MNLQSNNFLLHFPTKHRTNAASPQIDEIILLHQNINGQKVFTHLVSAIDEIVQEDNTRQNYRYGRNVRIIASTSLSEPIPVASTAWSNVNFQGISQGNACKIENIVGVGNYDPLLEDIWNRFGPHFRDASSFNTTGIIRDEIETIDPGLSVTEGRLRLITHLARERNRQIINEKKRLATVAGRLHCEACSFSFGNTFGVDFIECHHLTPIAQAGVRNTTLDDLALVCSNCHRMLHKLIDGRFLTIEELRERIRRHA